MRNYIETLITNLQPYDALEDMHIKETLTWIRSEAPIFRVQKPDIPPKHLVSYFVVFDEVYQKALLVDHKKAQLWLPAGGHVELNEDPKVTVQRECLEELGIEANFWQDDPLFITVTPTVGLTAGHIDVSLWYVLKGDSTQPLNFDFNEFNQIQWFTFNEIPFDRTDPHMKRFIFKLKTSR